ncbi:hypothetical protein ACOSQ3_014330 [Xanthoceras sorbifolium]
MYFGRLFHIITFKLKFAQNQNPLISNQNLFKIKHQSFQNPLSNYNSSTTGGLMERTDEGGWRRGWCSPRRHQDYWRGDDMAAIRIKIIFYVDFFLTLMNIMIFVMNG